MGSADRTAGYLGMFLLPNNMDFRLGPPYSDGDKEVVFQTKTNVFKKQKHSHTKIFLAQFALIEGQPVFLVAARPEATVSLVRS